MLQNLRFSSVIKRMLICGLIFRAAGIFAQDVKDGKDIWSKPAFSADAEALRSAAAEITAAKDVEATILLSDLNLSLDAAGRILKKRHMIYRIETKEAVEGWAEIRGEWSPWHQEKPQIKARVISADGVVHVLDPKTLNERPVHEDSPDIYSDRRAYGGPLPALAPGSIVEEEVITQDTSPFFSGGVLERHVLARGVPVHKTRFVLSHPDSLPVRYVLYLLADATVNKDHSGANETITIDKGPMEAYTNTPTHVPPDEVLYPAIEFTTAVSWQQVASEYVRHLDGKLRIADVQPIVSQLGLGKSSNLERISKIVAALHKNVRYTGVEFGESGLIPQFPGETLKRKYGDCKDKATLLIAMLRAADIPANLALLSAGPGEDINPELPGMGAFDHAIVHVPATTSSAELWIDATDEVARVGDLPAMDYGRWALIADEKTTGVIKTPELASEKNRHIETREFRLANYGPAQIVEKDEQFGPTEAEYRDFYGGDAKKVREGNEKYVKDEYLADALDSFDTTDPGDLQKPFVVVFAAKGRRGFTEMDSASVYIPQASLFNGLPDYFYKDANNADTAENKPKPRTVGWMIRPFTTEWHYQIMAPDGFKVRALPPDKDEQLGSARFVQKYSSTQDGAVVEALLRFETGKARLSLEEAKAMCDGMVKARKAEGISITFDQIGHSLFSAGKIKEALAADRQLVDSHPKDALQRIRLARLLLDAGLGEKARAIAQEAVDLDPKSAQVFSEQGWILEHDMIGRRFGKGFDFAGAVAAYRKAKQLNPKDTTIRANLAILLEYDAGGARYSKKANLEAAIAEFRELKKLDEKYARSYEDFIPYDLWYLGRFSELNEYVGALSGSDLRKAFTIGCIAALGGSDAAIKRSFEITAQEQDRSNVLLIAGRLLIRIRRYPEAAELLAAAAHGQANESQMTPFILALTKTKPFQESSADEVSPTGVIQNLFGLVLSGRINAEKLRDLMSKTLLQNEDLKETERELRNGIVELRSLAQKSDIPLETIADVVLSTARYSLDGNDSLGYKVTMQTIGAQAQDALVVREANRYKLAEFLGESIKSTEGIAWEVLARLQRNDLTGARKWLDWARERIHNQAGDDPLSSQPFPHFWTKGQEVDEAAMRTAALILLPSKSLKGQDLVDLIDARDHAKTDAARTDLNLVLAYAYAVQAKWPELQSIAADLMKAYPDSFIAYQFAAMANAGLKQFDAWEKILRPRLEKYPEEEDYLISAAQLAQYRGQFGKARELMKVLIDKGKASANTLNNYAWDALYIPGSVDQDAIDAAHRANDLAKNSKFDSLHTEACLYAAIGRTKEARELLFKAMEEGNLEEPNSAVWLGLASIAEQYGETDAARSMYARVEKQTPDSPSSNYALAQQRIAALQTSSPKAAGQ